MTEYRHSATCCLWTDKKGGKKCPCKRSRLPKKEEPCPVHPACPKGDKSYERLLHYSAIHGRERKVRAERSNITEGRGRRDGEQGERIHRVRGNAYREKAGHLLPHTF